LFGKMSVPMEKDIDLNATGSSVEALAIRYGLYTTAGLIAYFLLMKLLGLVLVVELRALNLLFLLTGIILALRAFKRQHGTVEYLQGIGLGLMTSAIGVVTFALFVFVYLQMDPVLMESIVEKESFGEYLNPYILAFVVALEGTASGFIATFVIMQYLKRSHMTNQ